MYIDIFRRAGHKIGRNLIWTLKKWKCHDKHGELQWFRGGCQPPHNRRGLFASFNIFIILVMEAGRQAGGQAYPLNYRSWRKTKEKRHKVWGREHLRTHWGTTLLRANWQINLNSVNVEDWWVDIMILLDEFGWSSLHNYLSYHIICSTGRKHDWILI